MAGQPLRIFDKFYLITVQQGRQGAIPYEYPPVSAADSCARKLPHHNDLINICFPDLEEIRKTRSLNFKCPKLPRQASTLGALGAQVSNIGERVGVVSVGPAAPPTLAGGRSSAFSVSNASAASSAWAGASIVTESSSGDNFRAELYCFSIGDPEDERTHGFVYRCLPSGFGMRYDVGKRYPECLCFLTRHANARPIVQHVLQHVHALRLLFTPVDRIESVLRDLYHAVLPSPGEVLSLKLCPIGAEQAARAHRHTGAAEGEMPSGDALAVVYLFQQFKPKAFLMLLSAMLCERRVCLVASETDMLLACTQAALGLLYPFTWQHDFFPVLPPSLLSRAAAPRPIVFGLRRQHLPLLRRSLLHDDLIYADLDLGNLSGSGAAPAPDIYALPNTSQVVQAAQKLGVEAAKAAERIDKAISKGVAFLQKYTGQPSGRESEEPRPDAANLLSWELSLQGQTRASNPIAWPSYGGGGEGVGGQGGGRVAAVKTAVDKSLVQEEQQLRDALLGFFVNIVGDASTYLRLDRSGKLVLDRDFYIGSRGLMGDGPHLSNFLLELVQSRAFDRLAETRKVQMAVEMGAPRAVQGRERIEGGVGPFYRCVETVRARGETFSTSNIKKALKAQSQQQAAVPANQQGLLAEAEQTSGRWTVFHDLVLQLTSNSSHNILPGEAERMMQQVLEDAYSSTLLPSILRTVWARLGDCKGSKWKHAHKSLMLLRELLLYGPEATFSVALSQVTIVRALLQYKGGGLGGSAQTSMVRDVAHDLLFLLLDGRRFMLERAVHWTGEKKVEGPAVILNAPHAFNSSFADLHHALAPPALASKEAYSYASFSSLSPIIPAKKSLAVPVDLLSSNSALAGNEKDDLMPLTEAPAFRTGGPIEHTNNTEQSVGPRQGAIPKLLPLKKAAANLPQDELPPPWEGHPRKPQWEVFSPNAASGALSSASTSSSSSLSSAAPPDSQWEAFPQTLAADLAINVQQPGQQMPPPKPARPIQLTSDALPPIQPMLLPSVTDRQPQLSSQGDSRIIGNPFLTNATGLPMSGCRAGNTSGAGGRSLSPTSGMRGMTIGAKSGGETAIGEGVRIQGSMEAFGSVCDPFAEIEKSSV